MAERDGLLSLPTWHVERLALTLTEGNLAGVMGLVALMEVRHASAHAALSALVASRVLRLVDVVAAELGVEAPGVVTAADVEAALAEAGA